MAEERVTLWLEDLKAGNEDAARKIFDHFSKKLCSLAQSHLSQKVQQRVDGEDVVQSVFRTFFNRNSQGQFEVDHTDELWRLLVTITLRKSRAIWRLNQSGKRNIARDLPLTGADENELVFLMAMEPTAVEAIVLADEIETLLAGLSADHSRALELRLGGYSVTEAAEMMGLTRQSFYRLLEPLKERLQRNEEDADSQQKDGSPE